MSATIILILLAGNKLHEATAIYSDEQVVSLVIADGHFNLPPGFV